METMRSTWVIFVALAACGSKSDAPVKGNAEMKGHVESDVKQLTALLPRMKLPDPPGVAEGIELLRAEVSRGCMDLLYADETGDPGLAATYKKLCNHDAQIALLRIGVEWAEADVKANPGGDHLNVCYSHVIGNARGELERNHTADAESAALEARLKAVCPK